MGDYKEIDVKGLSPLAKVNGKYCWGNCPYFQWFHEKSYCGAFERNGTILEKVPGEYLRCKQCLESEE